MTKILADYELADLTIRYVTDASKRVGLLIFPTAKAGELAVRRQTLRGEPFIDSLPGAQAPPAIVIDPLAHVKIVGDGYSGAFSQGRTMRSAPSNDRFTLRDHRLERSNSLTRITTILASDDGLRIEHTLAWRDGDAAATVHTSFVNGSPAPMTLEMLTSFSLGGLSPFDATDSSERLRVHRFRSVWSAEGRLDTQSIEDLHLERSWSGAGPSSERFGQVGSMPVRGWFPFVAAEDTTAGVTWGAQLAWAGSWQMEICRQHDDVCVSGGMADRELGHWMKTLQPGERLDAPPATLSCAIGGLDEVCDRLTAVQDRAVEAQPQIDQDLPVIFNEWCTTWGDPSHENLLEIADRLQGSGVRYLVIDAGWYKAAGNDWSSGHGDWRPSATLFPNGLKATADAIRARGLTPGLWFEMETVGSQSAAFHQTDLLLHRDGLPMTVRHRRFWDLNKPAVNALLDDAVINLLDSCGFGYVKVDYNETIGLGSDHPDGQGEGLRKQVEGIYALFERVHKRLPDLVIENCSSGGHRLEPSMLARTAMSSFSDAHELVEIPIIAASLHRLMLPRQSQIWAVLHAADSDRRLAYSLAATLLGRMCLSGEVTKLSAPQWALVRSAIDFYQRVAPIIKHGISRPFGELGKSWRHPRGWQAVRRVAADGRSALVVVHGFEQTPSRVKVPLPNGDGWQIAADFNGTGVRASVTSGALQCELGGDFTGYAVLLDLKD